MIFNGIEKDYLKVLRGLFRPPTPPIEFDDKGRKKRFTDSILPVPVEIKHSGNIEFVKQDLAVWLYHKKPKELIFKQIPDRLYFAEYESMNLNEKGDFATGVINFYLKDAFRYSLEKEITFSTKTTKMILGNLPTHWRAETTFTASQTGYELQFNSLGKTVLKDICKIVIPREFVLGDKLVIDYKTRRILLNGENVTESLSILQSNFKELPQGNVELFAKRETKIFYNEKYY